MKKLIFSILFSLVLSLVIGSTVAFAQDYFISNSGNDNNNGTTQETPWYSLQKVNSFKFLPGDVIHFKSGDFWRGQLIPYSGNASGYVTYTSYGFGAKPSLLGSIDASNPSDWKEYSKGIWIYSPQVNSIKGDVGNIIFNKGESAGFKVFSIDNLKEQNQYVCDRYNYSLMIYSEKNPGTIYKSIELALDKFIIDERNRSYIKYNGLDIKYGGAHGIAGFRTNNIIVQNCDISFMGGAIQFWKDNKPTRYGNGVEFNNNSHDNIVEGCNIWEVYDAAVTNQGSSEGNTQYNIIYRNNNIWNCEYSFEYWNQCKTGQTYNIYFENNICKDAGYGWGHNQRPNPSGRHLCFFSNTAKTSNIIIRNNTFENAKSTIIYLFKDIDWTSALLMTSNDYTQAESNTFATWQDKKYLSKDFSFFKQLTGKETNSTLSYKLTEKASLVSLGN